MVVIEVVDGSTVVLVVEVVGSGVVVVVEVVVGSGVVVVVVVEVVVGGVVHIRRRGSRPVDILSQKRQKYAKFWKILRKIDYFFILRGDDRTTTVLWVENRPDLDVLDFQFLGFDRNLTKNCQK